EPPAPLALPSQKVVDHALHDLAMRPQLSAYRVLEFFVPPGPAILFPHRGRGVQQLPARAQRGGNLRPQLPREIGNGLFYVDVPAIDLFVSKQLRKFLQNILANHVPGSSIKGKQKILPLITLMRRIGTWFLGDQSEQISEIIEISGKVF